MRRSRPASLLPLLVALAPCRSLADPAHRAPDRAGAARAAGGTYFVATDGDDRWSGRLPAPNRTGTDGPFATLERARDALRERRRAGRGAPVGGTVELRAGRYELARPFALTDEDSGAAGRPVVYRAHRGGRVVLDAGRPVRGFRPVSDPAIVARLAPVARGRVLEVDLPAQRITDLGRIDDRELELSFRDRPMTLARWPDSGFATIEAVTGGEPFEARGREGDRIGRFTYAGERPARWQGERDAWLHGYWFHDWADQRAQIAAIDPRSRTIALAPPYHRYGYRAGQWYYAFNLLVELDRPGEWYLDRATGRLYFWPPAQLDGGGAAVSLLPAVLTLRGASYVTLQGLDLRGARGDAITIDGGEAVVVERCTIAGVGGWGVTVRSGARHAVRDCEIRDTGRGGVRLAGGDRATLEVGGHRVINNHIHRFARRQRTYQPGVKLDGVGHLVANNLIHDAPHQAIWLSGNDHAIVRNEIHHVGEETIDAGAIYAGRDWTMRGNLIEHNYLHDVQGLDGRGSAGVYLDDMFSGTTVTGNLFVRVKQAVFIGGGRDNHVTRNVFVGCDPAIHVDARGLGWAWPLFGETLVARLRAVPFQSERWRARYPTLAGILDDEPAAAKGNLVAENLWWGGRWVDLHGRARELVRSSANRAVDATAFERPGADDYRIRPDVITGRGGAARIPLERIGLDRRRLPR